MLLYAKDMALVDDLGDLVDGDETGCEDAGATDAEGEYEGEGAVGSLDSPIHSGHEHVRAEHDVSSLWTKYKQCYYVPHKTLPSALNLILIAASYSHSIHASH
jgi:hypothetical protein